MPDLTKFELQFRVDSLPIPQPRQRSRVMMVNGKPMATNYTPSRHPVQDFKVDVKHVCQQNYKGDVMDLAFFVGLEFYFPRPANKIWKSKSMPRQFYFGRVDVDNLAKGVLDCLTGIIWTNDTRVVDLRATKFMCAGTRVDGEYRQEPPGVDVLIRGLT